MEWIVTNVGTIIVLILLAGIVGLIVRKMIHDKRAGKSACGCDCAHCHGACHAHRQSRMIQGSR